ncbi:MAG: IS630 family transposase [Nitrospira sp.]|nr:IS630 family transposase [Nitrospira sp.]
MWCEDECHFSQHGSRCTMWVPPENVDPVVLHAPTRKSVGVFGAVCVGDGRLVTQRADKFCAQTFLVFLEEILSQRRRGRKMVVVLDNARWHHARLLQPWLDKHRHSFRLDFLPPYSPELNPIERVWKLVRRLRTHNRYFPVLDELVETVFAQFDSWRQPNAALHRLCAII